MTKHNKKSVLEKIVDYLSVRDHSEKEIRNKLAIKQFEAEEVEAGLSLAEERGLMPKPTLLAASLSQKLSSKNKGILYINQYLKSKGLPVVDADWALETEKAKSLLLKRFNKNPPYSIEEKQDIYRYLINRGYADQTINTAIHISDVYEKDSL